MEIKEQPKSVREKERGLHVRGRDCSLSACAYSLRVSEQACTSARARVRLFALRVRVQSVCKGERSLCTGADATVRSPRVRAVCGV
jgi:hypothetical protein